MLSDDGLQYHAFPVPLASEFQTSDSYTSNEVQNPTTRSPESCESTSEQDSLEENDVSRLSTQLNPAFSGDSRVANQPHQLLPAKPQPARQRTTQACSKCRERKTKCSGHRPVCVRCSNRGLICEYAQRETRVRAVARTTRQYTAGVNPPASPGQSDLASRDMPTPAIHSRMGGNQTNAFASSSRNFGQALASESSTSNRLYVPMHAIQRTISSEGSPLSSMASVHPHNPASWHSPSPRIAGPGPPQHESVNAPQVQNTQSFRNGTWTPSSNSYIPVERFSPYNEQNTMFGQSQFQPPYPPLHIHDRGRTTFHNTSTGSMAHSSSLDQFEFGLSSLPSFSTYPPRLQDFGRSQSAVQQSPIPPSNSSGEAAYPPYISGSGSGSLSSFFDAHAPSPFYSNDSSNSSRSNVNTNQPELACPTPSIPIGFNALGETAQTFQMFDRGYYNMLVTEPPQAQENISTQGDDLFATYS